MTSMGPALNGIVNYDFWAPEPTMLAIPGVKEFLKEYQARAEKAGVDPLGYYLPPYSYAIARSSARPSRPPRASTSRRSPTTSAPPSSTRSSAR